MLFECFCRMHITAVLSFSGAASGAASRWSTMKNNLHDRANSC